jgi:hypothetical protein
MGNPNTLNFGENRGLSPVFLKANPDHRFDVSPAPSLPQAALAKARRSAKQIIQETMTNQAEFIPPAPPNQPPQETQA